MLQNLRWYAFRHNDGAYRVVPWPEEKSPVFDPDPATVEHALLVRRSADVPEDERRHLLWLPDQKLMQAWLDLHGYDAVTLPE